MIRDTLALAAEADVAFVGVGDLGPQAPLYLDGFISEAELKRCRRPAPSAKSLAGPSMRKAR
jgi:DNA-binding transcriptional regulator LsrR (DeoR family)